MPRLVPSLFRRAGRISPHLVTLLPACRTIESAQTELRWIRRHVLDSLAGPRSQRGNNAPSSLGNGRQARRVFRIARLGTRRRSTANPTSDIFRPRIDDVGDRVARLVARRGAGEPLQYVLGTQPFGDLDVLCEKGVLIPRPETEAWASMLADLAFSSRGPGERQDINLRILDLCSGTGCIGLSLYARGTALRRAGKEEDQETVPRSTTSPLVRVFGFDIEPRAVRLGRKNLRHNFRGPRAPRRSAVVEEEDIEKSVTFEQADIFADEWMARLRNNNGNDDPRPTIDILVSNPPYISRRGFARDTGRSVRNHEPKLALVPDKAPPAFTICAPEDVFYARLLEIADTVRPRVAAFEVGDMAQAIRVVEMAMARCRPDDNGRRGDEVSSVRWDVMEIWRDWPDCLPSDGEADVVLICGRKVPVRGSGHGRLVYLSEDPIPRNRFTNRGFRREVYTE